MANCLFGTFERTGVDCSLLFLHAYTWVTLVAEHFSPILYELGTMIISKKGTTTTSLAFFLWRTLLIFSYRRNLLFTSTSLERGVSGLFWFGPAGSGVAGDLLEVAQCQWHLRHLQHIRTTLWTFENFWCRSSLMTTNVTLDNHWHFPLEW